MQVQQPFSYVSGFPNEAKEEGNPIHALGQSVSFGRFMSESLAWEKWSSFSSHNKYVEEAERYSRPGSVAQKKAFFEAHYKELAARKKAAALLEQAQDASNNNLAGESQPEGEVENVTAQDSQTIAVEEQEAATILVHESESNSVLGQRSVDGEKETENCEKTKSTNQLERVVVVDSKREAKDSKLSGANQMQKPRLKSSNSNQDDRASMSKKKPSFSSSKSLNFGRATKMPATPAKPTAPLQSTKEINATPIKKKSAIDFADNKRSTPKSIHKSIYLTPAREINRLTSTIVRKIDGSKVMGSNSKASKDCSTPLMTPTAASVNGAPKHPLATPWSENRRDGTPRDSNMGSKTVRARWNFLPTDINIARIQSAPATSSKNEIRECISSTDPPTRPQSPKLTASTFQTKPSTPRQRPPTKHIGSDHVLEKKSHASTRSLASRPTKITHENKSPNIQHEYQSTKCRI
ncbi:TPX2 (Targeting protein for Xklp2) protein family [Citrus sinensis]|uniref:TPX2 (Targeting protein for Xklp2) protein family n=1 Tax=Citrus sinensis TaxID=2711 RepID=A0ACB8N2T8_CITSI|nr:TPX2 (Targeting protein for Xklp2) protein family [Citrus sinensis]